MEKGQIVNQSQGSQIRDYSGLRYGNITPTDIDSFTDFGGKKFVIVEYKYKDKELPYGQKLALERLVDALKVDSLLLIATHNNGHGDIDGANAIVTGFRYHNKWQTPKSAITVKQAYDIFLKK